MGGRVQARLAALEQSQRAQGPRRIFVRWPDGRTTVDGEPTDEQPGPGDHVLSVIYSERPRGQDAT